MERVKLATMRGGKFAIRFLEIGADGGRGEIVLDDFQDCFESPFTYWPAAEYERQWRGGLERIVRGEAKSALVTAMYPPESASFVRWWILFRSGNEVVFREHLLLTDHLDRVFDPGALYDFVPDRVAGGDQEFPISEWTVELASIGSGLA